MNLVRAQAWIEWVYLENLPSATGGLFLLGGERVKALPKLLRGLETVTHFVSRGGGFAPPSTVSASLANRPASASAMPCRKDAGIQESSRWRTNFATSARSSGGSALNCSMSSFPLTSTTMPQMSFVCNVQTSRIERLTAKKAPVYPRATTCHLSSSDHGYTAPLAMLRAPSATS